MDMYDSEILFNWMHEFIIAKRSLKFLLHERIIRRQSDKIITTPSIITITHSIAQGIPEQKSLVRRKEKRLSKVGPQVVGSYVGKEDEGIYRESNAE